MTNTVKIKLGFTVILVATALFFLGPNNTYAQETSTSSETENTLETPTTNQTATLSVRTQERIKNLAANVSNKMDATARRLQNISNRLSSRIDKESAAGKNTTLATEYLISAQDNINSAKSQLSTIDYSVNIMVGSQDPITEFNNLKARYNTISNLLRDAHSNMRLTISAIRNPEETVNSNLDTSSTTEETSEATSTLPTNN